MQPQPTTIDRYVIEQELGRGSWGVVYRAYDPQLNRRVALKYIPLGDGAQVKRFRREAQIAANLSHPHIVPIYDVIQTEEAVCIVMELLTGGTLHQRLTGPFPWQEGVSLLLPVCDALSYAHKQGVVHRDIKPENVMLSRSGEIKLADFGLAYVAGASRLTRDGGMVGTACYAAPEQIRGEPLDGRADVFSLAAVLYEMLTGQPLFMGDIHQVIYQILQAAAVDLSPLEGAVPPLLLETLARALAKDADDRCTADEFGVALRQCLAEDVEDHKGAISLRGVPAALPDQPERQTPIHIHWPSSMLHTPGEDELLRQLYAREPPHVLTPESAGQAIDQLIVKQELLGGFGGARVLVVIPVEHSGAYHAARVVKLGPRAMLEAECSNYDRFVKERLPTAVANRKRFLSLGRMAAIEYDFVGGGLLEPVCDMVTYYQEHTAQEVIETLRALVHEHLGQYWYAQGVHLQEHMAVEYGPHLPAHLNLRLRPDTDDWLGTEDRFTLRDMEAYRPLDAHTLLRDPEPAMPGSEVCIRELKVVRVKPWAATLEHQDDRRIRVRVEHESDSDAVQGLSVGQHVAVCGQVVTTRHRLVGDVVKDAFVGCQISSDEVLAHLGRVPYPDPLELYPVYLDQVIEAQRSVIHGDLHLRNVLVDRDGRPWLIDFGRVREGHTLFDLIKLETYIRLDVLSRSSDFTLAEYARFEEALADATYYGTWAARLPTNHVLSKAFHVIAAIRRLAVRFHPQETLSQAYLPCLLLYNLAVLKYARDATLARRADGQVQPHQLQAARLSYIAAAVQGRWIEDPPPPRVRVGSAMRQWRASLSHPLKGLARPAVVVLIIILATLALGLGYGAHRSWRTARQAQAESLNSQGVAYMQQGDLRVAEDLFGQAILLDSEYATAYHNLGMAYYIQGELNNAAEQFRLAIDLAPSYASPHYALGRVHDEQGREAEALDELRLAVEMDQGMSEAYNEIGLILNRQEKYAQAASILHEGLEKGRDRQPPYLLKNLGRSYLGLEDPARAVEYLEAAAVHLTADDALHIETHRLLAQAYEKQSQFDKALQEWKGPLQHEPDAQENILRLSPPRGTEM